MLPRFCKLCYQVVDESVVKFRRFSVKHSKVTSEDFSDEEYEIKDEEFIDPEEPVKKLEDKVCIIKCKNPKLNFYKGDTYPKFQPIPLASRGWQHRKSKDDYFTIYPSESVAHEKVDKSTTFRDINLHNELVKNLEDNNIIYPTLIQKLSIPKILQGHNTILTAETGCGKTFAFLVPLLQQIIKWKSQKDTDYNRPLGLIISPSRELIAQISKEAKKLTKNLNINIVTLYGGKTKKIMRNPPVGEVDLVIATLGVISKLVTTNIYKLNEVKHVVLDEADTLFDESFSDKLRLFLRKIPISSERDPNESYPTTAQITLNSATIPQNLPDTLHDIVDSNTLLPITTGHVHQIRVPQKFWRLTGTEKPMTLLKLIKPKIKNKTPIIIFSNTSTTCDFTHLFLKQFNIKTIQLHGTMPVEIRRGKFNEFQSGRCSILTTTDAGGRGLDTTVAKDVINFDMPLITTDYIHRCGRTGRIGSPRDCRVINFISRPLEVILTNKIEFATRKMKPIPMVDLLHNQGDKEGEFLGPNDDPTASPDTSDDMSELNTIRKELYGVPQ